MSEQSWQEKLRRMGVVRGTRNITFKMPPVPTEPVDVPTTQQSPHEDPHPKTNKPTDLTILLPGLMEVETADSTGSPTAISCLVRDKLYPITGKHGRFSLSALLNHNPADGQQLIADADPAIDTFRDFLFIDTETTGLAGAGTLAFMVGVGFFDGDVFIVRQYFLRDHGDEEAMLLQLTELLADKQGLISFNGRSFDIPLLNGRFLMNRLPSPLYDLPHFDLLHPARRLWKHRFSSCSLGNLEEKLLGVHRTHQDIPGALIPALYHRYLNDGDGRQMARVFYHNELDILSMVTLAAELMRQFKQPQPADHPIDLFSLGRWQADLGDAAVAEQCLKWALNGDEQNKLPLPLFHQSLVRLALLFKRQNRREEALPLWQQMAVTSFGDVTAHVELAKHYEWQAKELKTAVFWTEQAITLTNDPITQSELAHRRQRLTRKIGDGGMCDAP